jgi:exonuclease VII small subunit
MARALSVKVPTADLIALLENKIASIKTAIADYPRAMKQYKEDKKTYKRTILDLAIAKITEDPTYLFDEEILSVDTSYRGDVQLTLSKSLLDLPDEPQQPEDPSQKTWIRNVHTNKLEQLEKTLQVLRMTRQEEVNASTYNSVMELL